MTKIRALPMAAIFAVAAALAIPTASHAADSRVCVKNEGGFVARFEVDYTENGKKIHNHSGDFTAGVQKCIRAPEDATNVFVSVQEAWFINSWSTVCEKGFNAPQDVNVTVSGTTLNAKCSGL
ncbi:thiol-activated cytolysin C-terminal domain-containing protein [Roseovarius aestuariivivens]|uniref:thiol-activated cytolysin C-terminal domain-containing protein n=1 Tax=Roseovarius aestuariivivens TaxID=1888910 RepID=UPI001080C452|nr:thiol-activated cytolysin C-terminal domain-containing protein [Roseovarius aestuariivivens]